MNDRKKSTHFATDGLDNDEYILRQITDLMTAKTSLRAKRAVGCGVMSLPVLGNCTSDILIVVIAIEEARLRRTFMQILSAPLLLDVVILPCDLTLPHFPLGIHRAPCLEMVLCLLKKGVVDPNCPVEWINFDASAPTSVQEYAICRVASAPEKLRQRTTRAN